MRVRLEAIDSTLPNLALMKLSAHHKAQGDIVGFNIHNPDKVYISVIFTKNYNQAQGLAKWWENADVEIGGPGCDKPTYLPYEVEHIMPDYDLNGIDYSIGFSTRGCIIERDCPYCIVKKLEGLFREHAPISEFHHPDHKKLILFDGNILASKKFNEKLEYIWEHDLKVCFSQGLDARLVTDKIAEDLSKTKSYNTGFHNRRYYFAWDRMPEEDEVLLGLERMIGAGVKPSNMMVYVLVGYETSYQEDLYRLQKLIDYGVEPYLMIYNFNRDDPWLNCLKKWVNRRIYRTVPDITQYRPYIRLEKKKHVSPFRYQIC